MKIKSEQKYRIHFIGIGGIGMSGIAEIFLRQGHEVSGSDLQANDQTEALDEAGAEIYIGHAAAQIAPDTQVVVVSSAVHPQNPEVVEAKRLKIPVIPRAEVLAEILRGKTGITIAGTHGKTTTTSMVAQVLIAANLDPTVVVGGKVEAIGSNAKFGRGDTAVAEADESDGTFLLLPATYSVITNVDLDHMEHYQTPERLDQAFIQFVKNLPFYGCAWLCGDDEGVQRILPALTKPVQTYGFSLQQDLSASDWKTDAVHQSAALLYRGRHLGRLQLQVLGQHNFLNAMAAVGVSLSLGIDFEIAQKALGEFRHVRRRFDQRYFDPKSGVRVVDDYGHHPTEIRAVLSTARDTGARRIITVFQPHRYSRTQLCWEAFTDCFEGTDQLLLLPVYSAGEDPIEGVNSRTLLESIRAADPGRRAQWREVDSLETASRWIMQQRREGDFILTLGAGSITQLASLLAKTLSSADEPAI